MKTVNIPKRKRLHRRDRAPSGVRQIIKAETAERWEKEGRNPKNRLIVEE
jgi:hypothetical protein